MVGWQFWVAPAMPLHGSPLQESVVHDIERRVVEVIEGAPEHVWASRGFCYLVIAGRTIRVPNDVYGELRESNLVKVAFLPTSLVAVQVEAVRGMGLSRSFV